MVVAEIVERDRDGELIARPVEWDGPGEAPRILVRRPRLRRESAPAPGIGARALMRVEFDPDAGPRDPAYGGRVVKLLERARGRVLGVYRELDNGAAARCRSRSAARRASCSSPRGSATARRRANSSRSSCCARGASASLRRASSSGSARSPPNAR